MELEKKVQNLEEKLKIAVKREGELEAEVARLNAVLRATSNTNISKV